MSVHCVHCDADCGDDHRAGNGLPQTEHYGSDGTVWRAECCPACLIDTETTMIVTKAPEPDLVPYRNRTAYRAEGPNGWSALISNGGAVHLFAHDLLADNFDGLTEWANRAATELRAALAGEAS